MKYLKDLKSLAGDVASRYVAVLNKDGKAGIDKTTEDSWVAELKGIIDDAITALEESSGSTSDVEDQCGSARKKLKLSAKRAWLQRVARALVGGSSSPVSSGSRQASSGSGNVQNCQTLSSTATERPATPAWTGSKPSQASMSLPTTPSSAPSAQSSAQELPLSENPTPKPNGIQKPSPPRGSQSLQSTQNLPVSEILPMKPNNHTPSYVPAAQHPESIDESPVSVQKPSSVLAAQKPTSTLIASAFRMLSPKPSMIQRPASAPAAQKPRPTYKSPTSSHSDSKPKTLSPLKALRTSSKSKLK